MVVEEKNNKEYEVIDGQQRLTTMLILRQAFQIVNKIESADLVDVVIEKEKGLLLQNMYSIKYATRINSDIWLKELTLAYLKDLQEDSSLNIKHFQSTFLKKNGYFYRFSLNFNTFL